MEVQRTSALAFRRGNHHASKVFPFLSLFSRRLSFPRFLLYCLAASLRLLLPAACFSQRWMLDTGMRRSMCFLHFNLVFVNCCTGVQVCKFQAADHSVNAMRGVTAWLRRCCRFLRVPAVGPRRSCTGGARQICPRSVSKSFRHVGDVVVRGHDTSRTRVEVIEPLVGDMRVAQVFDSRNLLPSSFGEECASSPIGQP